MISLDHFLMLFIVAQYCLPSRILADPHLENINWEESEDAVLLCTHYLLL